MPIKVLIFDFDGTIVDSEDLKNRAYFEIFPKVGQKAEERIRQISRESRNTRYQKIREILSALKEMGEIKFDDIEKEIKKCVKKFGKIVKNGIINNQGIPGAFEELWFLYHNKYILYLLSGTPFAPLLQVVKKLVISGKIPPFKKIYGRIDNTDEKLFKKQALAEIMKTEEVLAKEIFLIGDGENERDVALEMGCVFIGIANELNNWRIDDAPPVIIDLKKLRLLLESSMAEKEFKA